VAIYIKPGKQYGLKIDLMWMNAGSLKASEAAAQYMTMYPIFALTWFWPPIIQVLGILKATTCPNAKIIGTSQCLQSSQDMFRF
jgi:hypothetical protein